MITIEQTNRMIVDAVIRQRDQRASHNAAEAYLVGVWRRIDELQAQGLTYRQARDQALREARR